MNSVHLIGNLTRDPELNHTAGGHAVCNMRLAVNDRYKDDSGQWTDRPYYFNVTVWGNHGEACAQYLVKGNKVGVSGKLTWREWEDASTGAKRQAVDITAFQVDWLTPKGERSERSGGEDDFVPAGAGTSTAGGDFDPGSSDDDIPF